MLSRLALRSAAGAWSGVAKKHTLPDLPYDYDALEPVVNTEIMTLHHKKHHAAYVNNLNIALEKASECRAKGDGEGAKAQFSAIWFNGGGHINHSIFWENLSPNGGGEPTGELRQMIDSQFESFDKFKATMSAKSAAVQGSGWGWLGYNSTTAKLEITTCANQDPLRVKTGLIPLLGIDVWEHAYYLQYKNVRPDYLKAIWNVVNWPDVAKRLSDAKSQPAGAEDSKMDGLYSVLSAGFAKN